MMSGSVLEKITSARRRTIEAEKASADISVVRKTVAAMEPAVSLSKAVTEPPIGLIAEIKPARPGIGPLRGDISVAGLAGTYNDSGAHAISVLTEPEYFNGSWDNLTVAKDASGLPVLCKDFIVDPFQLQIARSSGADAVLLIAASLNDGELAELIKAAHGLGLEVLTEAINRTELDRVKDSDTDLIGINSRNLHSLKIDLPAALALVEEAGGPRPVILESGISDRDGVLAAAKAGADGVLVGTAIMEAGDPGAKIRELLGDKG